MRILHVIPRWIGGGPERHLLALAAFDEVMGRPIERRVIVLDRPISMPLLIEARRRGMHVLPDAGPGTIVTEMAAADVVEVTYWNHPALFDLLRRPWPPCRLVLRSAVAGNTIPQVLGPHLVGRAYLVIASAPQGYGASMGPDVATPVRYAPALADMTRLETYAPATRSGTRVGLLGSVSSAKLHPRFVDVVTGVRTPGVRFDLYGDGGAEMTSHLRRALASQGCLDRFSFHGHVEDVVKAFSTMDVFAHPLAPGGYATSEKALQEAMWVGLPPVVMRGTAAEGWIEDGVTGFVAEDPPTFAAAIDDLAADSSLRRRIGEAARRYARSQFDPERNARRIRSWFEDVVAGPKRPWEPLPGADWPASRQFLQTLEPMHQVFLDVVSSEDVGAMGIAGSGVAVHVAGLLHGEGGVAHYANRHPHDGQLRAWAEILERRLSRDG